MNLSGRSFLTLLDYTAEEVRYLLDLSFALKRAKREGTEQPRLRGRNIALIFEKTSTRTRCAFEVAAYDQGAHVTYLGPTGSQMGHKESVADTARVLGRMYDGIEYRGFGQERVEALAAHVTYLGPTGSQMGHKESVADTARVLGRMYDGIEYRGFGQERVEALAEHAGVPVWNGLTDEFHPTQVVADVMTMMEHSGRPPQEISFCYLGDARNNVGNSLMVGGTLLGMDVRLCAPGDLWPEASLIARCRELAESSGGQLLLTHDLEPAVSGADFLYTDVWVSMGEPPERWGERIQKLRAYQVNRRVMELTGNPDVAFLHCLPAFHDRNTKVGDDIYREYGLEGMEVTDEVFESGASIVFDQAENRMHTIKAIMVATLAD